MARFYVTTPIYYVNDKPHLGHAYTSIAADAACRWRRLNGDDAFMLTGTDEHGDKVFRAARARGKSPQEHCDELVVRFQELLPVLGITPNDFIRTTEPRHTAVVQAVLQHLHDKGDLYAADYEGWYSTAAERFWTEKDLVDGKCPDSGQPVEWITEKNWFFRMSSYADRLRAWVADHPDFLRPESRKNEVLGYLRGEVGDLCISRPKSRLSWGITLPFDQDYVTYVWFDALLNYITARGYHPDPEQRAPDFDQSWPADFHLVGKDILTTHSVYWSTMLFAMGLEPARCLYAHGWWTMTGNKMSKSVGNVVDPLLLVRAFGRDAVRYFVLREIPFGGDGDFSYEGMMIRTNADLSNDLGNLAHRALSMTEKWLGGKVAALDASTQADEELAGLVREAVARFSEEMNGLQFSRALESLWTVVRAGNKYIDTMEPWKLNREGQVARLGGVLRRCLEICRIAAILLSPVCPEKARELADKLGVGALDLSRVDSLDGLEEGRAVAAGDPLFPRMTELPEEIQALFAPPPEPEAPVVPAIPLKEAIRFEEFGRLDLRSGIVRAAEKHPKADRLLVLQIDIGEAQPRTIVAGIASRYAPDDLVGLSVAVLANLEPAKIRGVESQGMLLAVGGKEILALLSPSEQVPPGSPIR